MDIIYTFITINGFNVRAENLSSTGNIYILFKFYFLVTYNIGCNFYIDLKSPKFEIN